MAFVCTIQPDRLDFDTARLGSSCNIRTRVGHDATGNINYFLMLTLDFHPTQGLEFAFNIIEAFADGRPEHVIWESAVMAELAEKEDRHRIRQLLFRLTVQLLRFVAPPRFCMTTYDADLPERALEKYNQLCEIFMHSGYNVRRTNPYHGRHAWFMDRAETELVE